VNDFNAALYFTFKDYCSFLKFTMIEMATYYFVIEHVVSESLHKHQNFHFVVPLPKKSEGLRKQTGSLGMVSSMLTTDSLQKILEGKFGLFERDREDFRKLKFRTFDMTHFGF
jgi:hypothetical protein